MVAPEIFARAGIWRVGRNDKLAMFPKQRKPNDANVGSTHRPIIWPDHYKNDPSSDRCIVRVGQIIPINIPGREHMETFVEAHNSIYLALSDILSAMSSYDKALEQFPPKFEVFYHELSMRGKPYSN